MVVRKTWGYAFVDSIVPTSRLRLFGFGLAAVIACCGLMLASAGLARAAGEPTTYTGTETIPVPPASSYAGSAGGDGWSVALSSTQVFNVFHHDSSLQVVCHNQADASPCWSTSSNSSGVDTITDPTTGAGFQSSGQPGMYLDQSTLKLYVYATETDASGYTSGVVCIDTTQGATTTDPFCGFTPLSAVGEGSSNGSWSALTDPMLVGNHWYAFNYVYGAYNPLNTQNKLLCFDVSSDQPCTGQPFPIGLAAGDSLTAGNGPTQSSAAIGHELIIPTAVSNAQSSGPRLYCFDDSTQAPCAGSNWPVAVSGYVNSNGAPFPLLDSNGSVTGFCLPTGGNPDPCFNLDGSSATAPAGLSFYDTIWNGPAVTVGPRVYTANQGGRVDCYDYSADAVCANFPHTFNGTIYNGPYTVNLDPQRPGCIWVNSDSGPGQIQNFDAFTTGSCSQATRAVVSQFVNSGPQCTPSSYQTLQISPAGTQGTVAFEDADGNQLAPSQSIPPDGKIDLAGIPLTTSSQFVITFNGDQAQPSQLVLALSWTAPYDASCVDDDDSATNPAITASGNSISAPEGQSFSGQVATFSDPDSSAKASDYSVSINWGDGTSSPGTISGTPSKFTVTGSHTYTEEGSPTATVSITDNDESGNNAIVSDKATVSDSKISASGAAVSATEGQSFSGTVASFSDPNTAAKASEYTASIDWGDGSSSSATITGSGGKFTVSGSHTYAEEGSAKVTVAITDTEKTGNNATVSGMATIADAALQASGATPSLSGTTVTGNVATFTDSDPNGAVSDYTASINWGDGTTTTGTVTSSGGHILANASGSGPFGVGGSHTYAKSGSYTITTTIKDVGGSTASAKTTVAAHVAAVAVKRGSAHLAAVPVACVRSAFTVHVRGAQIASVSVTLDGKKKHTSTVQRGRQYAARITLSPGRHMLTVHVRFKAASKTPSRTVHRTVAGCAAPRFTG